MKHIKFKTKLLCYLCVLISGCSINKAPYDAIKQEIGADSVNGYILLVYYSPLECLNCNAALVNVMRAKGNATAFLVFRSIRNIEVNDFLSNLKQQGNIEFPVLNDAALYNYGLQLAGIDSEKDRKPRLLLFSPFSKKVYSLGLKDVDAAPQLKNIISSKM